MKKSSKIYVAGHTGLVGSALIRRFSNLGYNNIIYETHNNLDLGNQKLVRDFFYKQKPEYVFLAAAKVGGIKANSDNPADFIYNNLQIQNNVIDACYAYGVKKLLFLGSSCIYPKEVEQPIKEEYLLSGKLEPTNDAYAIAKIAGLYMCKSYNKQYGTNFIAAMPTNLYGINDNFDLNSSHVLPALIRKFHDAKICGKDEIVLWGSGNPRREFVFVDDLAEAIILMMMEFDYDMCSGLDGLFLNIGVGKDIAIRDLAIIIKDIVGFEGSILWDTSMPDGTYRKLLDISKTVNKLGWYPKTDLVDGIKTVYQWCLDNHIFS